MKVIYIKHTNSVLLCLCYTGRDYYHILFQVDLGELTYIPPEMENGFLMI